MTASRFMLVLLTVAFMTFSTMSSTCWIFDKYFLINE